MIILEDLRVGIEDMGFDVIFFEGKSDNKIEISEVINLIEVMKLVGGKLFYYL